MDAGSYLVPFSPMDVWNGGFNKCVLMYVGARLLI